MFMQNISQIGPVVLEEKSFEWYIIYGHGSHLAIWIMTCFCYILYNHHINAKDEILLKLAV